MRIVLTVLLGLSVIPAALIHRVLPHGARAAGRPRPRFERGHPDSGPPRDEPGTSELRSDWQAEARPTTERYSPGSAMLHHRRPDFPDFRQSRLLWVRLLESNTKAK